MECFLATILRVESKVRLIPLPQWATEPLRNQINCTPGMFVFKPMINAFKKFDRILKLAGIEKFNGLGEKLTGHSFRHTYATLMADAVGHNSFLLKAILGHERISTTERYCHPTAPTIELSVSGFEQGEPEFNRSTL